MKQSGKRGKGLKTVGDAPYPLTQARQPRSSHPSKPSRLILTESQVLRTCLELLQHHPKVALAWRTNAGGFTNSGGQYVKFGFKGQPDLMAVVRGGKFLACETKATGKHATEAQRLFLLNVVDAGGYAVCVDNPDLLIRFLRDVV